MLVDSHCHLDRLKLEECGGSLSAAVEAARERGVGHLLCVCIGEENKQDVLQIAESYGHISASVGVHPSDVNDRIVPVSELVEWADHPKVVALGETGLDYHYSAETREIQLESFHNHLLAGQQLGLPVIVHTRNAPEDTIHCINESAGSDRAGVLHCFTETWELAKAALDRSFYISISGIVTFRNAEALREVVRKIPMDRLLIETDSPYLAPVPHRGKSNQPKYVREVAQYVADLKGVSYDYLVERTGENFFSLFSRAQRDG